MSHWKILKTVIAAGGLLCAASGFAAGKLEEKIEKRIKPVGEVCMAGSDCAGAPASAAASGPRSAKDIYTKSCSSCHVAGVAGAPKLGDAAAWAERVGKGKDVLYTSVIKGLNGMPAKGLCMDCSDDELRAVVDYMLDESQ